MYEQNILSAELLMLYYYLVEFICYSFSDMTFVLCWSMAVFFYLFFQDLYN